jgi:hypothetical protein
MGYSSISIGDSKTTPPTKESKMTHLDTIRARQASVAKALEALEGTTIGVAFPHLMDAVSALKRAENSLAVAAEYETRPHAALRSTRTGCHLQGCPCHYA